MSFMHGFEDSKPVPKAYHNRPEQKLKLKYEFKASRNAILDAYIVGLMLGLFLAMLPSTLALVYFVVLKEMLVVGAIIVGLSVLFSIPVTVLIFVPYFFREFSKPSVEWPVLTPEKALETYFAV